MNKKSYLTVKELVTALSELDENAPVVISPINEDVKCVLSWTVIDELEVASPESETKEVEYKGKAFVFVPTLIDIKTNHELVLSSPTQKV